MSTPTILAVIYNVSAYITNKKQVEINPTETITQVKYEVNVTVLVSMRNLVGRFNLAVCFMNTLRWVCLFLVYRGRVCRCNFVLVYFPCIQTNSYDLYFTFLFFSICACYTIIQQQNELKNQAQHWIYHVCLSISCQGIYKFSCLPENLIENQVIYSEILAYSHKYTSIQRQTRQPLIKSFI